MLVVALVQHSTDRLQHSQELLGNPAQTQRVDGGGPVPPLPPPSFLNTLTADGGGPVPPLHPPSFLNTMTADRQGPVLPLPPPNSTLLLSLMRHAPLLAVGGGPLHSIPTPSIPVSSL